MQVSKDFKVLSREIVLPISSPSSCPDVPATEFEGEGYCQDWQSVSEDVGLEYRLKVETSGQYTVTTRARRAVAATAHAPSAGEGRDDEEEAGLEKVATVSFTAMVCLEVR